MSCSRIETLLDDYVDDELSPEARHEVESHLPQCAACRGALDELQDLREAVKRLPRGVAPARDLLPGIREAVRRGPRAAAARSPWLRWAGVAASLIVLAGTAWFALSRFESGGPTAIDAPSRGDALVASNATLSEFLAAQLEYEQATARLLEALEDHGDLEPATRAVIEENLKIIDRAIEEVRAAMDADPGDARNRHVLNALYRQKVEFLWRVSRLSS